MTADGTGSLAKITNKAETFLSDKRHLQPCLFLNEFLKLFKHFMVWIIVNSEEVGREVRQKEFRSFS